MTYNKPIKDYGIDGKVVGRVKSDSADEEYTITEKKDGNYSCTCIGYSTSKKRPKTCKHIRRWLVMKLVNNFFDKAVLVANTDRYDIMVDITVKAIEKIYKGV